MKTNKILVITLLSTARLFSQSFYAQMEEKSSLYGIVNEEGKYVVEPKYKEVDFNFGSKTGLSYVIDKNDKYGFINENGKEIVLCKYDQAGSFENGYALIKNKISEFEYKNGLLDSTGKEVIPIKYSRLDYYPNEKVLVAGENTSSNVGVLDLNGRVIIPFQYEFWSKGISKGIWPVGKNNACGVVNMKNETIVPFIYSMIESYSSVNNLAAAQKDGKYGFIDRSGKEIVPFTYESVWNFDTYLSAKKDGKWGLIDMNNKIILPFEYSSISSAGKTTAWVIKKENENSYEINLTTKEKIK